MGAFHEGHLALMRDAKKECDFIVVSLFINPLQFGPKEDYAVYPKAMASDKRLALGAGVDLLWTPLKEEIYPDGYCTFVEVEGINTLWEGRSRPGHFRGVATVVMKLFQIVRPDIAYFGIKDYQQTRVIEQMVRDLMLPVPIRIRPTIREADGLAMSSRNVRLSDAERKAAPVLYKALRLAKEQARKGERSAARLLAAARKVIATQPLAVVDYLTICDPKSLESVDRIQGKAIFLAAVKIGPIRLIDNIQLA